MTDSWGQASQSTVLEWTAVSSWQCEQCNSHRLDGPANLSWYSRLQKEKFEKPLLFEFDLRLHSKGPFKL